MGSAISNSPAPQPDAEALKHLRASATFGDLDDEALGRLAECLIPVKFDAGEVVIEEGDAPDNAYFVVAGRLEVTTVATDGTRRAVGTRGPGDVVGEMALLTGESRSATVTALRDSRLYRMSTESFTEVVMMDPRILLDVTRSIASRLEDAIHDPTPVGAVSVVGVIPAGLEARHRQFAQPFASAVGPRLRTAVIDSRLLSGELGGDASDSEITGYLHRLEIDHDLSLLVADERDTSWSRRCGRQADLNLLVGHPAGLTNLNPAEAALSEVDDSSRPPAHLVVVRESASPSGTPALLATRRVDRHHHVRLDSSGDLERIARVNRGETLGLVLGGGGARGFAHLGVLKALEEAEISIDHIGGTSAGASVAAAYAMGWDWQTMLERERWVTVERGSLVDFSFPAVALASGRRLTSGMQTGYGDAHIEDMWIDFFCVSTDLTTGAMFLHSTGPVWKALRASAAIPGIFPPVRAGGHVLVDGGVLNNLPTDVMRDVYRPATLLAVDLRASVDLPTSDLGEDGVVSGWRVAGRRVTPWTSTMEIPRMVDVLTNATAVAGKPNADLADLVFRPRCRSLEFSGLIRGSKSWMWGYRHAIEVLEKWKGPALS